MLPGCKNFIEGADVKKQLEDRIAYENAPSYRILVEAQKGTGAVKKPAGGEAQKKTTDVFDISFDPDADFAFIRWEIYDKTTGALIPNGQYLQIDNIDSEDTVCKFIKIPDDENIRLLIKPVVIERPQIISASPSYDSKGAYRDARIQVMFDHDMDLRSVYYTTPETKELEKEFNLIDSDFLKVDIGTPESPDIRYYGYTKDGNIVYKNISIISSRDHTNLLEYFEAPRFEESQRLTIAPKKSHLPPTGSVVLVTLEKNFFYEYKNTSQNYEKPVTMRGTEKWMYFVNGQTDDTVPAVSSIEILNSVNEPITTNENGYLNKEKLIKIRMSVIDNDSGPDKFFKLYLYNSTTGQSVGDYRIDYSDVEGAYANCGNAAETGIADADKTYIEYKLKDLPDDDGNYKFKLELYDKNGNHSIYKDVNNKSDFLIALDATPPTLSTKTLAASETGSGTSQKPVISFTYKTTDADYKGGKLYLRRAVPVTDASWGDWSNATTIKDLSTTSNSQQTITLDENLEYGVTYELKAVITDKARNDISYVFKKNTVPQDFESSKLNYTIDEKTRAFKVTTDGDAPRGCNTVDFTCVYDNSTQHEQTFVSSDGTTYIYKGILMGRAGTMSLKAKNTETITEDCYANSGQVYTNASPKAAASITFDRTKPVGINGFKKNTDHTYTYDSTTSSYTVLFQPKNTCNNSTFSGVKVYKSEFNNGSFGAYPATPCATSTTGTSFSITDLEPEKRYKFKFVTYMGTETNTCDDSQIEEVEITVPAAPDNSTFEMPPKPNPVSSFTVSNITQSTATLSWTNTNNGSKPYTHYLVKYTSAINSAEVSMKIPKSATSTKITGLKANKTQDIKIQVCNERSNSTETIKTITTLSAPVIRKPVTNIYIANVGTNQTTGKYEPEFHYSVPTDLAGYKIYVCWGTAYNSLNSEYKQEDSATSGNKVLYWNTTNVGGFNAGTTYFKFVAKDGNDQVISSSDLYACDCSKIQSQPSLWLSNLQATPETTSIQFSWKKSQQLYSVRYKRVDIASFPTDRNSTPTTSSGWITVSSPTTARASYTLNGLAQDTTYDFQFFIGGHTDTYMRGVTAASTKEPEPTAVTNLTATKVAASKYQTGYVNLSWTAATSCDHYVIYAGKSASPNSIVVDNLPKNTTSYNVVGLESGTKYYFKIVSFNRGGNTEDSSVVNCTTDANVALDGYDAQLNPVTGLKRQTFTPTETETVMNSIAITYITTSGVTYHIWCKKHSDSSWGSQINNLSYNIYGRNDFDGGTKYDFKVVATAPDYSDSNPRIITLSTYPYEAPFKKTNGAIDYDSTRTSITVKWDYPLAANNNYYKIRIAYRPENDYGWPSGQYIVLKDIYSTDTNKPTSYTVNDLVPGKNYNFMIYTYANEDLDVVTMTNNGNGETLSTLP